MVQEIIQTGQIITFMVEFFTVLWVKLLHLRLRFIAFTVGITFTLTFYCVYRRYYIYVGLLLHLRVRAIHGLRSKCFSG